MIDFNQKPNNKSNTKNKVSEKSANNDKNEKIFAKQLIGKHVVSKTGKQMGEVGDLIFETRTGELIHMVIINPTEYTENFNFEKDKVGNSLIPFSVVIAIGDFIVVSEEDII
jgi:sporulation protein YlmC with PRC-barrel domain